MAKILKTIKAKVAPKVNKVQDFVGTPVRKVAERNYAKKARAAAISADRRAIKEIDANLAASRRAGGYVSPTITKQRESIAKRLSNKKNYR